MFFLVGIIYSFRFQYQKALLRMVTWMAKPAANHANPTDSWDDAARGGLALVCCSSLSMVKFDSETIATSKRKEELKI